MKIFKLLIAVFTASLFLASCSTQSSTVSIKKRHFNKGYYVAINHKQKAASVIDQKEIRETPALARHNEQAEEVVASPIQQAEQIKLPASPVKEIKASSAVASTKLNPIELPALFKPVSLQELKQIKTVAEQARKSDNNSIIWTIIIVLLVLWLLSYFMGGWGIGGIINLLLAIAIVLIILVLLGII